LPGAAMLWLCGYISRKGRGAIPIPKKDELKKRVGELL